MLVTGATGHIGGWLVRRLVHLGAEVCCLVKDHESECMLVRSGVISQTKLVQGDLRDEELIEQTLRQHAVVTVFHLAAQSIVGLANRDPAATFDTNIRGTWCLLEACRMNPGVRQVVVASTDKVYGECRELPYTEDMPLRAIYPHDVSKACAEMIARCYAGTYNLNIALTRLPNVYGGGDLNWSRIVPGTIRSIIRGERPIINSNGQFLRDYLYVEDAVEAHLVLAEQQAESDSLRGQALNISAETYLSVIELVERISRLMGSSLTPQVLDTVRQEIPSQYLSAAKTRQILGWQASYSLEEGLKRTIDWYREYLTETSERDSTG